MARETEVTLTILELTSSVKCRLCATLLQGCATPVMPHMSGSGETILRLFTFGRRWLADGKGSQSWRAPVFFVFGFVCGRILTWLDQI